MSTRYTLRCFIFQYVSIHASTNMSSSKTYIIYRIQNFDCNREASDYLGKTAFSSAYQWVGRLRPNWERTNIVSCLFNKKMYLFINVQLISLFQFLFWCAKCFITPHHFFSHKFWEREKGKSNNLQSWRKVIALLW